MEKYYPPNYFRIKSDVEIKKLRLNLETKNRHFFSPNLLKSHNHQNIMYFGEKVKKQTERRCFLTCQKRAKSAVFLPVARVG